MMPGLIRALPLALLAACATLTEEQCRAGNWRDIGVADGAEGRSVDFLEQHARACGDFGISPDRAAWLAGREEGLKLYCTPQKAYDAGRRGQSLRPVCAPDQAAALEDANRTGMRYYDIGRDIDEIEALLSDIRSEIASLPPGDPRIGLLNADYARLSAELGMLRARRLLYASYP